jgi:hypothetical protein
MENNTQTTDIPRVNSNASPQSSQVEQVIRYVEVIPNQVSKKKRGWGRLSF